MRFTTRSFIADRKRRGVADGTFQIGLVEPEFVWGGNKIKRRDISYSSDEEDNEYPPPESVCDECHWESPLKGSDDEAGEWKTCPEICRPPKLKLVPSPCDECSWESPCESDDEPCEWQPCPDWCPSPAPKPPKVTQIWDGQVQAPCHLPGPCPLPPPPVPGHPQGHPPRPPQPKVTQIWDGQIQGPVHRPPPHHPLPPPSPRKAIQIWDGQIQAPPPHPWYKRMFKRDESKNYQRSEMAMP